MPSIVPGLPGMFCRSQTLPQVIQRCSQQSFLLGNAVLCFLNVILPYLLLCVKSR